MTILYGEQIQVESLSQFVERTRFSWVDILEPLDTGTRHGGDFLEKINAIRREDGYDEAQDFDDVTVEEAQETIVAHNISSNDAIISVLEKDDADWVHTFDGTIHTLIEITGRSDCVVFKPN